MSQYKIQDDREALEQCPFDPTHMIRHSRMPYHIMQCKRNHAHLNYKRCLYNARHWVPAAEFEHHKMVCPDKVLLENSITGSQKVETGTYYHGDCSTPPQFSEAHVVEPSGEDWDLECDDNRRAFKWGEEDARDYFNNPHPEPKPQEADPPRQLRLPHGTPQVLQENGIENDTSVPRVGQQRLPHSLPMTHQASARARPIGFGRGRGYGTLQQVAPTAGGPTSQQLDNQFGQNKAPAAPPGIGRGRGYGAYAAKAATAAPAPGAHQNGYDSSGMYSDGTSSTSSTSSSNSRKNSSVRSRQPRAVNVPLVGNNGPTVGFSSAPAPFTEQAQPNFVFQGLGRGLGAKPKRGANGSPAFIVPNINAQAAMNNRENEKPNSWQIARKYQKKLREIESIEKKLSSGSALNSDEESKLGRKKEILLQLEKIRTEQD